MRSTRATFFVVIAAMATAVFGVGCAAGDDAVVATDLGLTRVVIEGTPAGQGAGVRDDLSLRTQGQAPDEQVAPGEVTGRPSPPTLSANPVVTAPATTSTVAPTTTSVPTTPEPTASTEQTTTTAAAPASSEAPPSEPDSVDSSTTTLPADPSTSAPTTGGPALEPGEGQSFTLLNNLRSGLALNPLVRNAEMDAFARDWSRQMAESGRFEHSTGPYGENIAFTSNTGLSAAEAADLFHQLWVDSPGHYANMTNEQYTSTGVGLYLTERGWYGTHVFNF